MVNMHGTAARLLIVVASAWTACLQLFASSSLAYRAAGDSWAIDLINVAVLGLVALAGADLVWHDILRRGLVWPSYPPAKRHQVCVAVYSMLAGAFGIRAFVAAGDAATVLQVGGYYVLIAAGIAVEAAALANEKRSDQCRSD